MKKKFNGGKEVFEKSQKIQDWIEERIYDCFQKKDGTFPDLEVEVRRC